MQVLLANFQGTLTRSSFQIQQLNTNLFKSKKNLPNTHVTLGNQTYLKINTHKIRHKLKHAEETQINDNNQTKTI